MSQSPSAGSPLGDEGAQNPFFARSLSFSVRAGVVKPRQSLCGRTLSDTTFRIFESTGRGGRWVLVLFSGCTSLSSAGRLAGSVSVEAADSSRAFRAAWCRSSSSIALYSAATCRGRISRGAIKAVKEASNAIPRLRLFECQYATIAGGLTAIFCTMRPTSFQSTLGAVIMMRACSPVHQSLQSRGLGRGAFKDLGKTPASSVRLGTKFGYEHQCFRGRHEIVPTNIVIRFREDVSSI